MNRSLINEVREIRQCITEAHSARRPREFYDAIDDLIDIYADLIPVHRDGAANYASVLAEEGLRTWSNKSDDDFYKGLWWFIDAVREHQRNITDIHDGETP